MVSFTGFFLKMLSSTLTTPKLYIFHRGINENFEIEFCASYMDDRRNSRHR